MAPDPTAFATLGALFVLRLRHGGWLLVIPVAACLVSGATLWAMASPEFWIAPLAAALAAVFAPPAGDDDLRMQTCDRGADHL